MEKQDRPAFARTITGLAVMFNRELTEAALDLWWEAMRDRWTLADFTQAANAIARTSRFMPMPADFEALREGAGSRTAEEWWPEIVGNVKRSGYRRGELVAPTGSLVDRALHSIGGYSEVGRVPEAELHFVRQRFIAAFNDMRQSERARTALPHVAEYAGLSAIVKDEPMGLDGPHRRIIPLPNLRMDRK